MKVYNVHLEFIEPILGTASSDPYIHDRFIASKAPDAPSREEEVAALGVDELQERGTTVFHKTADGEPFLWNYQIKGFFKDACYMLRKVSTSKSKNMSTYKKDIDGLIFPTPRCIVLHRPDGAPIRVLQRPLRAQTAQGERVALASSEMLDAGTWCDFEVKVIDDSPKYRDALVEWFSYGQLRGIGQWRNAGHGSFSCRITDAATGKVLLNNIG